MRFLQYRTTAAAFEVVENMFEEIHRRNYFARLRKRKEDLTRSPAAECRANWARAFHFQVVRPMFRIFPQVTGAPEKAAANTLPTHEFHCAQRIADRSRAFAARGTRPCAPSVSNSSRRYARCLRAENPNRAKVFPLRQLLFLRDHLRRQ